MNVRVAWRRRRRLREEAVVMAEALAVAAVAATMATA
jgi:hypothetical protein